MGRQDSCLLGNYLALGESHWVRTWRDGVWCGVLEDDPRKAVVDPHELGVLEVVGESFGVGGGHELVFSCPDDEDRAGEVALLVGPLEQLLGRRDVAEVLVEVAADLGVVAQRMDPAPEEVLGDPLLGQGAEGHREMADPARAQQLGGQEGAAGQRCVEAQQPARQPGRVVVEGLTGDQDQVGDTIGAAGADEELRAAPVVADHCDVAQVQFGEEPRDPGGERREGEVGVVGHRCGVRSERQLRDDAAVAIPQAADDGVPQGAVHQHPVQQHHHRPVAAGVGIHETARRGPLKLHPRAPSPVSVETAYRRRRPAGPRSR